MSSGISKWLAGGVWAVADHALFSGANFAVVLLLARWLPEESFGAFSVAYSVFLLVGVLHNSLLGEPLTVLGPGVYRDRFRSYLATLVELHLLFTAAAALLLAIIAILALRGSPPLAEALAAAGLASPFALLPWLIRRAGYAMVDPRNAALSSAAYLPLVLGGMYVVEQAGLLTTGAAYAVFATAGLASSIFTAAHGAVDDGQPIARRDVVAAHLRYGVWAAAGQLPAWAATNLAFLVLPIWFGVAAAGTLRAAIALLLPAFYLNSILATLIVAPLVRARDTPLFRRVTLAVACCNAGGALVYGGVVALAAPRLVPLAFGERFSIEPAWIAALGVTAALAGVREALLAAMRALERTDRVFWAQIAFAGLTVVWLPFVPWHGVAAVIYGSMVTNAAAALLTWRDVARLSGASA
jgi:O-antigen/teichoic acid export membrane protein